MSGSSSHFAFKAKKWVGGGGEEILDRFWSLEVAVMVQQQSVGGKGRRDEEGFKRER